MKTSALARIAMMAVLLVCLLFPLMLIYGLVAERAGRRIEAAREVSAQWGDAQTVTGPLLSVDFRTPSGKTVDGNPAYLNDRAIFLPVALRIDTDVVPETRRRGIFEVIVYRSRLKISGRFSAPEFSKWRVEADLVLRSSATLSLGISDPRGITGPIALTWNGTQQTFVPGTPEVGMPLRGISAVVAVPETGGDLAFDVTIETNGTRELRFLPAGNETFIAMRSSWPHPSFVGAPLPHQRSISNQGFTADWNIPYYGRSFPTSWSVNTVNREQLKAATEASAFGVALLRPVDIYQQAERAVKYAALFIVLTFVIAFLWEIIHGAPVHPVQYIFIGFALCVFYLLLLALSEHIGFDVAYVVAAAANVALIAWYWSWVIRGGPRHGVLMAGALTALYGYLYLLLRQEDHALLGGALGLFVMLALVMYLTRRIDWYTLTIGRESGN